MNIEEKIKKLSSAVTDYRGKKLPGSTTWIVRPKPLAVDRVKKWLAELGRDPDADLLRIDRFGTFVEFHEYLREIRRSAVKTPTTDGH